MRVKQTIISVLLLTLSACGSLKIQDTGAFALMESRGVSSTAKQYSSVGVYSDTEHVNDGAVLEAKLSDELFDKKIRSLTATTLFPGASNKDYGSIVRLLKRDSFTALLVIKNLDIQTETLASQAPSANSQTSFNLKDKVQANPYQTISADIEFIDLTDNSKVWSGKLTFQDTSLVPVLLQKTAAGIADYLEKKKLITADKALSTSEVTKTQVTQNSTAGSQ